MAKPTYLSYFSGGDLAGVGLRAAGYAPGTLGGPTHLSLFTGIGGIDLAAGWAGFRTVAMCERDPYCRRVLAKHWPDVPCWEDVRGLTADALRSAGIGRIDLLSGGFPCQPFSNAGQRRGVDDDRHLWPEMLRVVREVRPAWVLGENVGGLINLALDLVATDLEAEGYDVETLVFPAGGVGALHLRQRCFIVAHADRPRQLEQGGRVGQQRGWAGDGGPALAHPEVHAPGRLPLGAGAPQSGPARDGADVPDAGRGGWGATERDLCAGQPDAAGGRTIIPDPQRGGGEAGAERAGWPARADAGRGGTSAALADPASVAQRESAIEADAIATGGRARHEPLDGGCYVGDWEDWDGRRPFPAIWDAEPRVGRLADGVPARMDRLRAHGNAVVPQQVYPILCAIYEQIASARRIGAATVRGAH